MPNPYHDKSNGRFTTKTGGAMSGDAAAKRRGKRGAAKAVAAKPFKPRFGQWVEYDDPATGETRVSKYRGLNKDGSYSIQAKGKNISVDPKSVRRESDESRSQRINRDARYNRRGHIDTSVMANPNLKVVGVGVPDSVVRSSRRLSPDQKKRLKDFQASMKTMTASQRSEALKRWYAAGGASRPM